MDWAECKLRKFARPAKKDVGLINSLLLASSKRIKTAKMLPLNGTTSSTVVSLYYDSLREILEAVALKHNYKIYNHECFFGFLKTELGKIELAEKFDRFRKIRNSINYYGSEIHASGATDIVNEIGGLRKNIIGLYFPDSSD